MSEAFEEISRLESIDIFVEPLKKEFWQGVCTVKMDNCNLAAVSVTKNLSNTTKDLFTKIAIQMHTKTKKYGLKQEQLYLT